MLGNFRPLMRFFGFHLSLLFFLLPLLQDVLVFVKAVSLWYRDSWVGKYSINGLSLLSAYIRWSKWWCECVQVGAAHLHYTLVDRLLILPYNDPFILLRGHKEIWIGLLPVISCTFDLYHLVMLWWFCRLVLNHIDRRTWFHHLCITCHNNFWLQRHLFVIKLLFKSFWLVIISLLLWL